MPAEVHFATFFATFLATVKYGMEGAQAVCKNRVHNLGEELKQLLNKLDVYLRCHCKTLLEYKGKVREVLLTAMNRGLKAGMIDLVQQGGALQRKYQ